MRQLIDARRGVPPNGGCRVSRVSKVPLGSGSKVVEQANVDAAARAAAVKESASSWSGPLDELK